MTIQELYDWAVENNVTDAYIIVRDSTGANTDYIEPEIVNHKNQFGIGWTDVEL